MPTLSQATSVFRLNQKLLDKKLSKKQKGQLRIKRLAEAEEKGELINITNRQGIFKIVGLDTAPVATQYSWFRRVVGKGYITESLTKEVDKNGKPLMEYHIFPNKTTPKKLVDQRTIKNIKTAKKILPKPTKVGIKAETPEAKTETPKATKVETPVINIPVQPEQLAQGFSLTLNLTFNIGK